MRRVLFEHELISVWYHSDTRVVHHEVHKRIGSRDGHIFRQALTCGLDALRTYGGEKWLSDDRSISVLSPDEELWGRDVWFPSAIRAGWKYWAVVRPEKAVSELFMARIAGLVADRGVMVGLFATPAEGLDWLATWEADRAVSSAFG